MRDIALIVVHCSATPASLDIGVEEITDWHRARGFSDIGYHRVIRRSGEIEDGRPLQRAGAHAAGHNAKSIGVCLVGGVSATGEPEVNFTNNQKGALMGLLNYYQSAYPNAAITGHGDLPGANKACPCFDLAAFLEIGSMFPVRGATNAA